MPESADDLSPPPSSGPVSSTSRALATRVARAVPALDPGEVAPPPAPSPGVSLDELRKLLSRGGTRRFLLRAVGVVGSSLQRSDREDVAHDVLLRAWDTRSPPRSVASVESWLFASCDHAVKNFLRRRGRQQAWVDGEANAEEQQGEPQDDPREDEPLQIGPWIDQLALTDGERRLVEILRSGARDALSIKQMAERAEIPAARLSRQIYDFKERYVDRRHRHLEKVRAYALWLGLPGLGVIAVAIVVHLLWPDAPPRPPMRIDPIPVVTARPVPSFDQAVEPPSASAPPPSPPPPREDKPTAPRRR